MSEPKDKISWRRIFEGAFITLFAGLIGFAGIVFWEYLTDVNQRVYEKYTSNFQKIETTQKEQEKLIKSQLSIIQQLEIVMKNKKGILDKMIDIQRQTEAELESLNQKIQSLNTVVAKLEKKKPKSLDKAKLIAAGGASMEAAPKIKSIKQQIQELKQKQNISLRDAQLLKDIITKQRKIQDSVQFKQLKY